MAEGRQERDLHCSPQGMWREKHTRVQLGPQARLSSASLLLGLAQRWQH